MSRCAPHLPALLLLTCSLPAYLLYPSPVKRLRVGVLYGGRSGEHEVSLASAAAVFANLDRTRYEPVPIRIEKDGRWAIADRPPTAMSAADVIEQARLEAARPVRGGREVHLVARPSEETILSIDRRTADKRDQGQAVVTGLNLDVIFPVLHGPYGEDGTIQGLLELANVPYVGAGVLASAVGMDKAVMKLVFAARGLPVCAVPRRAASRVERATATRSPPTSSRRSATRCSSSRRTWDRASASRRRRTRGVARRRDGSRRQLRPQDRRRGGGAGRARDRVRGARQRRAGRLGARRGRPVARVLRLRGEVPRRRLEDHHPGGSAGGDRGGDPAAGDRGVPGDRLRRHGARRLPARARRPARSTSTK